MRLLLIITLTSTDAHVVLVGMYGKLESLIVEFHLLSCCSQHGSYAGHNLDPSGDKYEQDD